MITAEAGKIFLRPKRVRVTEWLVKCEFHVSNEVRKEFEHKEKMGLWFPCHTIITLAEYQVFSCARKTDATTTKKNFVSSYFCETSLNNLLLQKSYNYVPLELLMKN